MDSMIVWTGANELGVNGNSENNARFTPSGNPLGNFIISKYYFVLKIKTINIMVDRSVLYTIELFTLGVKALIHTRVVLMLENTDY